MRISLRKQCLKQLSDLFRENGQDLVEYALLVALIAFGLVAGMKSLANGLNTTLTNVGATLAGSI